MAYLEQLLQQTYQQPVGADLGLPLGAAYASYYGGYETQSPSYPTPNPYSLAQIGFRSNELAYACINERSARVSEAPVRVYELGDETEEVIKSHPLELLLKKPCPRISQSDFWKIVMTYTLIAGNSIWEKERNNRGEVIALWSMRPDWCSFLRGQQQPIRAVRYQPYGLPPMDIDVSELVIFQYFDPLYPLLKGLSPTAVAMEIIQSDNAMTRMVTSFITNGAFLGGVLKTEQALQDSEADRIKMRWKELHGGADKSGEIAVFGKGVSFERTNNTFREMVFPEVDARNEARICMIYKVSPLTIAAKVGIGVATYNNYKEARDAGYESVTSDDWNYFASVIENQLLPDFETNTDDLTCMFDTSKVKALQEDRSERWTRAENGYKSRFVKLDEARKEAGLDPVGGDEGDSFYEEVSETNETPPFGDVDVETEAEPVPPMLEDKRNNPVDKQEDQDEQEKQEEVVKFRKFAKSRIKEKKARLIPTYEFKHHTLDEQHQLLDEFTADALLEELQLTIGALNGTPA